MDAITLTAATIWIYAKKKNKKKDKAGKKKKKDKDSGQKQEEQTEQGEGRKDDQGRNKGYYQNSRLEKLEEDRLNISRHPGIPGYW